MVNSNVNQAFEILFDAPEVCETEVREAVKKFRQKNEQSSNTKSNASRLLSIPTYLSLLRKSYISNAAVLHG